MDQELEESIVFSQYVDSDGRLLIKVNRGMIDDMLYDGRCNEHFVAIFKQHGIDSRSLTKEQFVDYLNQFRKFEEERNESKRTSSCDA